MFTLPWVVGCSGPSGLGPAADLDPVPAAHSGAPMVHSAVAHTGLVATGSTGMPSYECDLPAAVEVDGGPRVAIQELRVAVIRGDELSFASTLQVIDDGAGTPWLILPGRNLQDLHNQIYGFRSPVLGSLRQEDATGLVDSAARTATTGATPRRRPISTATGRSRVCSPPTPTTPI